MGRINFCSPKISGLLPAQADIVQSQNSWAVWIRYLMCLLGAQICSGWHNCIQKKLLNKRLGRKRRENISCKVWPVWRFFLLLDSIGYYTDAWDGILLLKCGGPTGVYHIFDKSSSKIICQKIQKYQFFKINLMKNTRKLFTWIYFISFFAKLDLPKYAKKAVFAQNCLLKNAKMSIYLFWNLK